MPFKDDAGALADLERAVKLQPDYAAAWSALGAFHQNKGLYAPAAVCLKRAVQINPELDYAHNSLAWFLATCPDPNYRNGQEAVAHATRAVELSRWKLEMVDTLAAAPAATGDFEGAATAKAKVIEAAPKEKRPALRERLAAY